MNITLTYYNVTFLKYSKILYNDPEILIESYETPFSWPFLRRTKWEMKQKQIFTDILDFCSIK